MTESISPHENDVLFGRGFTIIAHAGNRNLRSVVEGKKSEFLAAKKKEKRKIAGRIVEEIQNLDPPGRFLIEDPNNANAGSDDNVGIQGKVWLLVEPKKAVDKVMHRLRERDKPISTLQQGEEQHSSNSSFSAMPFGAGLPSDDLTRLLQNMQQSGDGNNCFPNVAISMAHAERQNETKISHPSGMNVDSTNGDHSIFQDGVNNQQHRSQPFQQLNNQQHSFQHLNIQQDQMQQFGSQSNIGSGFCDSQSVGSLGSSGAKKAQTTYPIGRRQNSTQLNESQFNCENKMFGSKPAWLPGLGANLAQPQKSLQSVPDQRSGLQQLDFAKQLCEQADPSLVGPNFLAAKPSPQQQFSLTTSTLYREVPEDKAARHSNELSANADATKKDPIVGHADMVGSFFQQEQQVQVLTIRGWIDRSMPRFFNDTMIPGHLTPEMSLYIKSAIPLALKLTECLAETESHADSLPSASITCENLFVRLKSSFGDARHQNSNDGLVDQIMIKSCADDMQPGSNMPQLFSLGVLLYEIFSSQSGKDAVNAMAVSAGSAGILNLNNEAMACDRPLKRPQLNSSYSISNIIHAEFISKLEVLGIPQSLCTLVVNLLDCIQGDLQSDDAYRSLADVQMDLQLMRDNPSHFLDNLPVKETSFEIGNKFYGRQDDISCIEQSHQRHMSGDCGGMFLSGGAGVGKSSLVSAATRKLASKTNSYFLEAKFDQSEGARPLSTIASAFNSLCDMFAEDATQDQLEVVAATLHRALGNEAALLAGVLPSLTKLLMCSADLASDKCVDLAASMQFLFMRLIETLSEHRRISFFLDDLQFADPTSLLLISSLLSNTEEISNVFFACCYRDDNIHEGGPFWLWLSSMNTLPLEMMELKNISIDGVNELLSETLHLSPRITRPLASTLHHKTRGNPLFLRQLLDLLRDQGYIYLKLSPRRWAWDIDKILNLEISDDVVALLIKEMRGLDANFQLGLKVAACIGSCTEYRIFDILSQDLGVNLRVFLDQAVEKGYMVGVDDTKIRFVHDKIEQAAYEMLPVQERLKNHMKFGLALTAKSLDGGVQNDAELFFVAVHQINRGGPDILSDPNQRDMVAALNLRAGKRSMDLSDFSTALSLFEHGITFLDSDTCWTAQYALSLELFDSAVEMACTLNDAIAVRRLSEQVFARTKCNDDKLNCLYAVVKSLRLAYKLQESKRVAFTMLEELGERLPRPMGDLRLEADILELKLILQGMSDESILNMKETSQKKRDILITNLYHDLNFLFQFIDPKRIADSSLRMVQITLSNGLCSMSPHAYAQFAIVLVTMGDTELGYRLGTLALRLLEKMNAQRYTSAIMVLVGNLVSWVSEPLQSIADSHLLGYQYGQRNGDVVSGSLNYQFYLQVSYLGGQSLSIARANSREFAHKLLQRKQKIALNGACSIYLQTIAFMEGLEFEEEEKETKRLPSWDDMVKSRAGSHIDFSLMFSSHLYMRSFLFKQYDDMPQEGLFDRISEKNVPLRPLFFCGIFFEGLLSFQLARQEDGEEHRRKGDNALELMRKLSASSKWNFENKYLLLKAEAMNCSGYYDQASQFYGNSIRSSNEHKFIHEEAVASELAAAFFYERELDQESYCFFLHSVNCYNDWGASAIARRVEHDIAGKFGPAFEQLDPIDDPLLSILSSKGSAKRREE